MKPCGIPIHQWLKSGTALTMLLFLLWVTGDAMSASPVGEPMLFKTPEAAAEALLAAFKNNDDDALAALFGAKYSDRLLSKDKVAARESRERLYQAAQKVADLSGKTRRTGWSW